MSDDKKAMDLCHRLERMCRYSALDTKEVDGQSMKDRDVVAGLYKFFRDAGDNEVASEKKARAGAIRLILCETLT